MTLPIYNGEKKGKKITDFLSVDEGNDSNLSVGTGSDSDLVIRQRKYVITADLKTGSSIPGFRQF